jgi:hypothetical protein
MTAPKLTLDKDNPLAVNVESPVQRVNEAIGPLFVGFTISSAYV